MEQRHGHRGHPGVRRQQVVRAPSPQPERVDPEGEAAVPPVILSKSTFPVLNCLEGDVGARHIFRSPEFRGTRVRYAAEWAFIDVDTPDEMERARLVWSELQLKAK